VAALLSLLSATVYGVGDFCGGLAARRAAATAVLLWSHVVGLVLVIATLPVVSGQLRTSDLALGAIGGLAGAAGVGFLYQGLSIGPMSVVAPITALLAAGVPVIGGILEGDRPGTGAAIGMAMALVAIVLVSAEGGGSLRPSDGRAVTSALAAGVGFGVFFLLLSYTSDDAGTWPLLAARVASVTVVGLAAVAGVVDHRLPRPAVGLTALAGAFDVGANLLYLLAVRVGLLSVVSVLSSLYPVSTVVLARIVLHERFHRAQQVGLAIAVPAVILMVR
jgi:drug/metabolite transporter (DMT)-like permease